MCRTTTSIIGLAMAGLSFAQSSTRRELFPTVTLYVPGADVQPLVASIVGSVGKTTKYPRLFVNFRRMQQLQRMRYNAPTARIATTVDSTV
jgi:hypothetical protein